MPGVIDEADRAARELGAEFADRPLEGGTVEIGLLLASDQRKAEFLEGRRDQPGIVDRVVETRNVLIRAVADYQRDAAFSFRPRTVRRNCGASEFCETVPCP